MFAVHVAVIYFLLFICLCVFAVVVTIIVQHLHLRAETKPLVLMPILVSTDVCAYQVRLHSNISVFYLRVPVERAREHILRAVGTRLEYDHKAHSHTIRVYGWRRGVVVTSYGASSKLLYAEPG